MNSTISKILGQPIQEAALEQDDVIHMILGCCGSDQEKLKKGLKILSKGQLKKLYAEVSGKTVQPEATETEPVADATEKSEEHECEDGKHCGEQM